MRLFIFGLPVQESYDLEYPLGEDFTSLDFNASKQISFLKLHRSDLENQDIFIPSWIEDTNISQSQEPILSRDSSRKYGMYIFPKEYEDIFSQRSIWESIDMYLRASFADPYITTLNLAFFRDDSETRGRMRDKKIYLYSLERLSDDEVFSVFIHEFWHYYDIYGLPRTRFQDLSDVFYDISWESVDVLKAWQWVENFVSGYAMTNQYEDFAESYIYYILHNSAFREKSLKNTVLARKYAFFEQYSFPQKEFYKRNFWTNTDILPYYWDITKIEIDREKFLQYIKIYL